MNLAISYIMFFIFLIFYLKKLKYEKITQKTLIRGIIIGIISIVIVVMISTIFGVNEQYRYNHEPKFYYFINVFIYAALIEEFSKFLALKIYNPQKKDDYIIYSLIIGLTFWIVENIVYGFSGHANIQWQNRLLHPGHPSYQVIMGILLYLSSIQSNKVKKNINIILSILLTTFIHTLFNCLRGYTHFPISENIISIYITVFEYYIIIVGLYIFKKKIGEQDG